MKNKRTVSRIIAFMLAAQLAATNMLPCAFTSFAETPEAYVEAVQSEEAEPAVQVEEAQAAQEDISLEGSTEETTVQAATEEGAEQAEKSGEGQTEAEPVSETEAAQSEPAQSETIETSESAEEEASGNTTETESAAEAETQKETAETESEAASECAAETETQQETVGAAMTSDTETSDGSSETVNISDVEKNHVYSETIDGITITVTANAGVFPEGAELAVEKVEKEDDEELDDQLEEALSKKRKAGRKQSSSIVFDIKMLVEGEEVQPDKEKGEVYVTITMEGALNSIDEADLYHILEQDKGNKTVLKAEKLDILDNNEAEKILELSDAEGNEADPEGLLQCDGEIENDLNQSDALSDEGAAAKAELSITAAVESFSYYVVEFTYPSYTYEMCYRDDSEDGGLNTVLICDILEKFGFEDDIVNSLNEAYTDDAEALSVVKDIIDASDSWYIKINKPFSDNKMLYVTTANDNLYEINITCKALDKMPLTVSLIPEGTDDEKEEIRKIWEKTDFKPVFYLYKQNGTGYKRISGKTATAEASNDWTATFKDLPCYGDDGKEIIYFARPNSPTTLPTNHTYTGENWRTYHQASLSGTGYKIELPISVKLFTDSRTVKYTWDDKNNAIGLRQENIPQVYLNYGDPDNLMSGEITAQSETGFSMTWTNIPNYYDGKAASVKYVYPDLSLYYSAVSNGTNTYKLSLDYTTANYKLITKTAITADMMKRAGLTGIPTFTATLFIGGEEAPLERVYGSGVTYERALVTSIGTTTINPWTILNRKADGTKYGSSAYSVSFGGDVLNDKHFVTEVSGNTLTVTYPYVNLKGIRVLFDDDENNSGLRPTGATVRLLANGEDVPYVVSTALLSDVAAGKSPNEWEKLPRLDAEGNEINYTLQVEDIPAYYSFSVTPERSEPAADGGVKATDLITISMKKQTAKATVIFEGAVGGQKEMQIRPSCLDIKLECSADGGNTWEPFFGKDTYVINATTDRDIWTYEWNSLPAIDSEGMPLIYRAEQMDRMYAYVTTTDEPVRSSEGGTAHTEFSFHNTYQDDWNYNVRLQWTKEDDERYHIERVTTATSQQTVKYTLAASFQKTYSKESVEIRLPYELFDNPYGESKGTVVNRVSLGDYKNPSPAYSFTYRIENKGTSDTTDDEIIFYNYKDLKASDNIVIEVEYKITPFDVPDCEMGVLAAHTTAKYDGQAVAEEQETDSITYRIDTGAAISNVSKAAVNSKLCYSWPWESKIPQPDDFDMSKYNYITYPINFSIKGNQTVDAELIEQPKDGGKVYLISKGSTIVPFEPTADGGAKIKLSFIKSDYSSATGFYYSMDVIVAYPREKHNNKYGTDTFETDYNNTVTVTSKANHPNNPDFGEDLNDDSEMSTDCLMHWKDYEFIYSGELYSPSKSLYYPNKNGLSKLEYNENISISTSFGLTVNGYHIPFGYKFEVADDAVYARASINGENTEFVRLTEDDYEFTGRPYFYVRSTEVDRSDGHEYTGEVTEEPFEIYGRRGQSGDWELIDTFTGTAIHYVDNFAGKGYTQVKVVTPDDLKDKYSISANSLSMVLKADSPIIRSWIEQGADTLTVRNYACNKIFRRDEEGGELQWYNKNPALPSKADQKAKYTETGVMEEDLAREGAYLSRALDDEILDKMTFTSDFKKSVSWTDDVANEMVYLTSTILGYEASSSEVPEELKLVKSMDDAYIYDLLPVGFSYDPSKSIEICAANRVGTYSAAWSVYSKKATLESVKTVDDYKGTGRQLVIFHLLSTAKPGQNWINYGEPQYTGFGITFTAKSPYNELIPGKSQYNIAAMQRADLNAIAGAKTEEGKGPYSSKYPKDAAGVNAMADINGDGIIDKDCKNTFYDDDSVTFNILQTLQNGLSKRVKGVSGAYSKKDTIDVGKEYSYKLLLQGQKNGESLNIVLYDIFENAENTDDATGEKPGWRGSLVSVDTRKAVKSGVSPVVYYSTREDLNYNECDDLRLETAPAGTWTTTAPADLSTVTAVAIDMRKTPSGADFILEEDNEAEVEIVMNAPPELQPNQYAYNRPAYFCEFRARGSVITTSSFNISSRTVSTLRNLQDVEFYKLGETENGTVPLPAVKFCLYKCTSDGTPGHVHNKNCFSSLVQTAYSGMNGKVSFSDIDTGVYAIKEMSTPTGYKADPSDYWYFTVDADIKGEVSGINSGGVNVMTLNEENGHYELINKRELTYISVKKTWSDDSSTRVIRPKQLTFELYRNGELYRTETVDTVQSNVSSETFDKVFDKLLVYDEDENKYIYEVREKASQGYTEKNGGVAALSGTQASFTNNRTGVLTITKELQNSGGKSITDSDKEFEITAVLTNSSNVPLKETDTDGNPVTFEGRRYVAGASDYTVETLKLTEGGKLTVKLKGGEKIIIIGIPVSTKYAVTEEASSAKGYNVTYTNKTGTVTATNNLIAKVINKGTVVTLRLPFEKIVDGGMPSDTSFTFKLAAPVLSPVSETMSSRSINISQTVTAAAQRASFEWPITYRSAGSYTYTVTESAGTNVNFSYDTVSYTVNVDITEKDGLLDSSLQMLKNGKEVDKLIFTNLYQKARFVLPVEKKITGSPSSEKSFRFELKPIDEAPMPEGTADGVKTASISGAGSTDFGEIVYDKPGTYKYTVNEIDDGLKGYIYDGAVYSVAVEVTASKPGVATRKTLTKDGAEASAIVFTNTYKAEKTSYKLPVKKLIKNNVTGVTEEFSFVLESKGDSPMPADNEMTIQGAGIGYFDPIEFTEAGIYEYTAYEKVGTGEDWIYDSSKRTIRITVSDKDGQLEPELEVDEIETESVTFENEVTYKLRYHQVGAEIEGMTDPVVPSDAALPENISGIRYDETISVLGLRPVTEWITSDGTDYGVPGTWSFSEYWTEDETYPAKSDITTNSLIGIRSDKDLYGKWVFTPYIHDLQIINVTRGENGQTGIGGKVIISDRDGNEQRPESYRSAVLEEAVSVRFYPDDGFSYNTSFVVKYWMQGEDLTKAPHTVLIKEYIGEDGKPVISKDKRDEHFYEIYSSLMNVYPYLSVQEGSVILNFAPEAMLMPRRTVVEVSFLKKPIAISDPAPDPKTDPIPDQTPAPKPEPEPAPKKDRPSYTKDYLDKLNGQLTEGQGDGIQTITEEYIPVDGVMSESFQPIGVLGANGKRLPQTGTTYVLAGILAIIGAVLLLLSSRKCFWKSNLKKQ